MIEVKNLTKIYKPKKGVPVKALDGINLTIEETGMVFILGKSGSGKSTLLNTLGGLDKYDDGEIIIKGKSSKNFTQAEFDSLRNTYVGFIFQEYNILDEFTVGANIALAMELQGKKATNAELNKLLETVDLAGYANRKPNELSGGQKQRVAIARALIKDPEIIMADEPTGALDSNTGKQVFETLQKLSKTKLVIIVSHDREFAEFYGDRVIELADGKIISDIKKYKATSASKSDGVSVIDDKIIHIKKGYALTENDLSLINSYLKSRNTDTIISIDEKTNTDVKHLARIDDDGNRDAFTDISKTTIDVKQYTEKDFKLIKSKLPIKNALKIGASSLKVKPFRLFITILLSVVAFTLFGLADTISAYNKVTTTVNSIQDSKIDYISYKKQDVITDGNNNSFTSYSNFSQSEIDALSENYNCEFLSVCSLSDSSISLGSSGLNINDFKDTSKIPSGYGSYYTRQLLGVVEIKENTLQKFGYSLIGNSTLPDADDEILISDYIYEHFKQAGWQDALNTTDNVDINSENDIIGKTISSNNKKYTICGVFDTKFNDDGRYDSLKETDTSNNNDFSKYFLINEFNSTVEYGPCSLGFVKKGFLKANNLASSNEYVKYHNNINIYFSDDKSSDKMAENTYYSYKAYSANDLKNDEVTLMNGITPQNIGNNDMVVNLAHLRDRYNKVHPDTPLDYSKIFNNAVKQFVTTEFTSSPEKFDDFISNNSSLMQYYNNSLPDAYEAYYKAQLKSYFQNGTKGNDYIKDLAYFMNLTNDTIKQTLLEYINTGVDLYCNVNNMTSNSTANYLNTIVGFTNDFDCFNNYHFSPNDLSVYLSAQNTLLANKTFKTQAPFSFTICATPSDSDALTKLVELTYNETGETRYLMKNSVMETLGQVNYLLESMSNVFLYIGIAFAVFAGLLMMNFISTSISYKKREIGILRAVGARSNDVFSIFFSESFIIALINWLFAMVSTIAIVVYLNFMLRNDYNLQITLLNIGVRQIGLILLLCVFVAFIASFLPVQNIARKKPIDSIRNR